MKTQTFEVARLRGVDNRWRVSADSASNIEEMSWNPYDGWKTAGAYDCVSNKYKDWRGQGIIHSIHFFSRHNGRNRDIIFEDSDGTLAKLNPSGFGPVGSPFITLKDLSGNSINAVGLPRHVPPTSEISTQSISFGGRLYLINGQDDPIVYDGRTVSRCGFFDVPSKPDASVVFRSHHNEEVVSGGDKGDDTGFFLGTRVRGQGLGSLNPTGNRVKQKGAKSEGEKYVDGKLCGYQYRVTFVNRRGQEGPMSDPSDICSFECANGKRRFTQVNLPVGGPEIVARRVYRTRDIFDGNGNPLAPESGRNFYFLKEVQDNEATAIEDGISDANLGTLTDAEDFGLFPKQGKLITSFKNTVFVAGMPNNLIKYSAEGMPEVFPRDNIFDIGDAESGEITGMYASTNALVVFKSRGIYLIKGDPRSGFYAQTLTRDIGCIAPRSIQDVPQTGLVFLGSDGVYVLKGALENTGTPTSVVLLSTPIRNITKRIDYVGAVASVGVINRNSKEYYLCVPTIGEKNNLLLVWHYSTGSWSQRFNYPIQCAVETRDTRSYVYFGSNLISKAGINVYSNFYRTKYELGAIASVSDKLQAAEPTLDLPLYETSPLAFGSVYQNVQVGYINVYAVAYGTDPLKINFKINRSETVALDENKSRVQQDVNEFLPVYGKARFDEDFWGFHRPVVLRYDVSHMHKSVTSEFSVQFKQDESNNNPNRMMIVGYSIDLKTGDQRNIRPLTDVLKFEKR
ncbi:MAG: hypothetical protein CMN21_00010 [Rubinisphaera sp.]|uniref:hypothetical protein n=1 Tax=Rubinisphaera sp. TaxID=2024857 RepID=UPI000C0FAEC2|nr:hypothetical protein [Rubinisphaera sp.]MBV07584.1 hypothetical protein [Rubinisphaera sp.]